MYYYSPVQGKQYYLQLLLTTIQGPISFKDLYIVYSKLLLTFYTTCVALGLLKNNREQITYFKEAIVFTSSRQLQSLFITMLLYRPIVDLLALQICFYNYIYNNLPYVLSYYTNLLSYKSNIYLNYSLFLVSRLLIDQGKSTTIDFQLLLYQFNQGYTKGNKLLVAELLYDYNSKETQF